MNKLDELRAKLRTENAGKHYLKQLTESECTEELCAEIDALRLRLTLAEGLAGALKSVENKLRDMPVPKPSIDKWTLYTDALNIIKTALAAWEAGKKEGV